MELTIQEYLSSLKGKKVAVLGIGVSNTPLIKMLLRAGIKVTACDKNDRVKLGGVAEELESLGAELCLGEDYLDHLKGHSVIFRTPGMRPDLPQLAAAQENGALLTSEMEVFFRVCPCPIIAVTGSDGKTTTTTIISKLLEAAGYNTYLGGNIGKPLLTDTLGMEQGDIAVVELSSFQLMTMDRSPHIAVVTNLSPNHLDVHKSMGEYVSAKANIFLHQLPGDKVVLNFDNSLTRSYEELAPAEITWFSRREPLETGVYLKNDAIWYNSADGARREVLPVGDIKLPGVHNIENYMAAIAAVDGLVSDGVIRDFARSFGGVEHRIELVRERNGVKYYNDSIASSPSRTIAGLRSFDQKVILIAGGYDKQIPFEPLGPEVIEHVKALVLTGDTAEKLRAAVEGTEGYDGTPAITVVEDFQEAVLTADRIAQPGDIVLLSPACASFDRFKNFAQRGETFKRIVLGL